MDRLGQKVVYLGGWSRDSTVATFMKDVDRHEHEEGESSGPRCGQSDLCSRRHGLTLGRSWEVASPFRSCRRKRRGNENPRSQSDAGRSEEGPDSSGDKSGDSDSEDPHKPRRNSQW